MGNQAGNCHYRNFPLLRVTSREDIFLSVGLESFYSVAPILLLLCVRLSLAFLRVTMFLVLILQLLASKPLSMWWMAPSMMKKVYLSPTTAARMLVCSIVRQDLVVVFFCCFIGVGLFFRC